MHIVRKHRANTANLDRGLRIASAAAPVPRSGAEEPQKKMMDAAKGGGLLLLILPLVAAAAAASLPTPASAEPRCLIFNFGDSNSDTGGLEAGLGFPMGPPHSYLFFGRSTGRWCDGRLYIDFLCQSRRSLRSQPSPVFLFRPPHLRWSRSRRPVLEDELPEPIHGALGIGLHLRGELRRRRRDDPAGRRPLHSPDTSAAVPTLQESHRGARRSGFFFSLLSILPSSSSHIRRGTIRHGDSGAAAAASGAKHLTPEEGFRKAIYSIDVGQNDISTAFYSNLSYAQVVGSLPPVLSEIQCAVEALYAAGARKFLVYNTGPLGCLPKNLARNSAGGSDLDPSGCLETFNSAAKAFNSGLTALCDDLRAKLKDAAVVCVDMYAIKYDLVADHAEYGFERPLMACCGYGGPPYNFKERMTCGQPDTNICERGSRFVSWDGVHYAEAANAIVADKIISGSHSTPPITLDHLCDA